MFATDPATGPNVWPVGRGGTEDAERGPLDDSTDLRIDDAQSIQLDVPFLRQGDADARGQSGSERVYEEIAIRARVALDEAAADRQRGCNDEREPTHGHAPEANAISAHSRALIRAAATGRSREVGRLLSQPDTDPEADDEWGFTALSAAALHGHARCVKRLLPHCDANRVVGGVTALHDAAMQGHAACVRLLIQKADVNATVAPGLTPLMMAAAENRAKCVELLMPHSDASMTCDSGDTAASLAAQQGAWAALNCLARGRETAGAAGTEGAENTTDLAKPRTDGALRRWVARLLCWAALDRIDICRRER